MQSQENRSAVQAAAILILLRMCVFFCGDTPFSMAYAKQMLLTAGVQAALILPLLRFRHRLQIPPRMRFGFRLCAAWEAAYLTHCFGQLAAQLNLRYAGALLPLMLLMLLYTVPLHDRASARTASLLLFLAVSGFLLLPVSGIGTAQRILLHTPAPPVSPLREWADACELPFLPLLMQQQTEQDAKRSTAVWAGFRLLFLPALVLFGTMQNGRLLHFQGNPFFLLLARTPLSDAVRTDGFWLLLACGCGALCITFCLQTAKPHLQAKCRTLAAAFLPYFLFLALLWMLQQAKPLTGIVNALFGIMLPWGMILYRCLMKRRDTA